MTAGTIPTPEEYAGVLLALLMDDDNEVVPNGPLAGSTRREIITDVLYDVQTGGSWLWCSPEFAVLKVTGRDTLEVERVMTGFNEDEWELIGQPRPGLNLYRRRRWWTRLWCKRNVWC